MKTLIQDNNTLAQIEGLIESSYKLTKLGLYDGKCGALLAFHNLKDLLTEPLQEKVRVAIESIQNEISDSADLTDLSFGNGIFGIGWAIGRLFEENRISENKIEIMNEFDDELYKLIIFKPAESMDVSSGTMGRIIYYLTRVTDELRLMNKYRYIINYEILILLINDFTTENERILSHLRGCEDEERNRMIERNGGSYCDIFMLLSIMIRKEINMQIVERQHTDLASIFFAHFHFAIGKMPSLALDNISGWNSIAVVNCVLWMVSKSESLRDPLLMLMHHKPLFAQYVEELIIDGTRKEVLATWFRRLSRTHDVQAPIERWIHNQNRYSTFNCGINGAAGSLYTRTLAADNKSEYVDLHFISFGLL